MEAKDDVIYLKSKVNELFATTELTQYFTNELKDSIELTILFPIKEEISLSKFVVTIDDKLVISKVMPKEKAEEKYNDSIASGNIGFYSSYQDDQKSYSVNVGNIKPNQKITLNTVFIQMIGTQDMSYEYNIMEKYPTFHYKELNKDKPRNKTINADIEIETQSKITRLIAPFMDEQAKKNSSFKVQYNQDYKKATIKYIKNPDDIKNINTNNMNDYSGKVNAPTFYSSFCILFRTEKMNKPILYYQYNPEFKETAYSINYVYASKNLKEIPIPEKPDEDNTISYTSKYEDNAINETPGLFIFLVDQSGSMGGNSINLVKQALLLFIKSLPVNSYFQLIGFGSNFKKYNEEPVLYNKENVDNIINIINGLKADLGGTNISSPLSAIYNDNNYSKINLSKNIFLLTDGQVHDREQCINLITTNSSKFRIHSLGIGRDFDKILIERCGKLGKGSSSFVEDVEKINSVVINTLNKCLRAYITDIKFEFENYKEELANKIIACNPINNFTYQNEVMNYSFILPNNKELKDLKIKITGKDPINIIESNINLDNMIKIEDGEEMGKMIIGKALKNNDELLKDEKKEIEFAKKYQILSKNTSLFAEIPNEENQQSKLIKVNLNEFKNEIHDRFYSINKFNFVNALPKRMMKMSAPPMILANYSMPRMMKKCSESRFEMNSKKSSNLGIIPDFQTPPPPPPNPFYNNINNNNLNNKNYNNNINNNNNNRKDGITRLIMGQDTMEGFWEENEETKKIINIITLEKFNKMKANLNNFYKGQNEIKLLYTILVIYYLKTKCSDRLDEFRLIINKANKYLEKNGIKYENIISSI